MSYFDNLFPIASHKTISGNLDSYNPACDKGVPHVAAANALTSLYNNGTISDVRLYRVYIFYWNSPNCDIAASWQKSINPIDKNIQIAAMQNSYLYFDPSILRFALVERSFFIY